MLEKCTMHGNSAIVIYEAGNRCPACSAEEYAVNLERRVEELEATGADLLLNKPNPTRGGQPI